MKLGDSGSGKKFRNRYTALICVIVFFLMLLLSFASVPLYRLFCQATGFGGTPRIAEDNSTDLHAQMIEVRFDANVDPALPWSFVPEQPSVSVHLGETKIVFFSVKNHSHEPVTGIASFNVTPEWLAQYFHKIECFCFTEQTFGPGESVDLPVAFFIDPAILEEKVFLKMGRTGKLPALTLSYTFFPVADGENSGMSVADRFEE